MRPQRGKAVSVETERSLPNRYGGGATSSARRPQVGVEKILCRWCGGREAALQPWEREGEEGPPLCSTAAVVGVVKREGAKRAG